jgi:hypothetical protein
VILESVAACSAALNAINAVVSKVNETGSGVQQLYGMCSDFLQALDDFEANKKASTFTPLSSGEMLRLAQIRKSFERQQKSIEDCLAMLDPELLQSWREMRATQEQQRKEHMAYLARRKKQRKMLMQQIAVGTLTFITGSIIAVGAIFIIIEVFA